MDDKDLIWEEVSTEHIVQDEWIDFRKTAFRFPDGKIFEPFYTYSRRDYVVIVASDEDGNYICVKQFRQGIREVTTEFPAGGIERKDGKQYGTRDSASSENALIAAKRELLEETGYVSDEWTPLITIPSNATIADNYAYVFEAKNCRKTSDQSLDEMEFLNVELLSADDIQRMISEGNFKQAIHVMGWLMSRSTKKDPAPTPTKINKDDNKTDRPIDNKSSVDDIDIHSYKAGVDYTSRGAMFILFSVILIIIAIATGFDFLFTIPGFIFSIAAVGLTLTAIGYIIIILLDKYIYDININPPLINMIICFAAALISFIIAIIDYAKYGHEILGSLGFAIYFMYLTIPSLIAGIVHLVLYIRSRKKQK